MHRFLFVILLLAAQPSLAGSRATDIVVSDAAILETTPVARAAAGYLSVANRGDEPIRLTAVESDFADASIHESVMSDGVMRMEPRRAVVIHPGATATFERGGLHVMFTGLTEQLRSGASVDAVLVFDGGMRVPVTFEVRSLRSGVSEDIASRGSNPQSANGLFRGTTSDAANGRSGSRAPLGHGHRDDGDAEGRHARHSQKSRQTLGGRDSGSARDDQRYGTNPDGTKSQTRDRGNERMPRP